MKALNCKGVIFDMDGVIVDSERLYLRFWQEACATFGFELSREMGLSLRSNSPETAIPKFAGWFGDKADYLAIREVRRKMMAKHIDQFGVDLKSGAGSILDSCREKGMKTALATASPVKRARHYLAPYGLFEKFDAVVSGSDIASSKPAPDIYIKAAQLLGLAPGECIAVEDSPSGIISAKTAGCFTVMIPDLTQPDGDIADYIDLVAQSLDDLTSLL